MKQTIFSGIQPTAQAPHLGNYLGALRQWAELQTDYRSLFCVVDLHALTVPQEGKVLNDSIYATYAILLAIGIDPKLSILFVQSHNPHHAELSWILNGYTHMGELSRMTQFKEKSLSQKEIISAGLFDYPVLMAADILLYDTEVVPVGEDQIQHVELTRDIAERFNNKYGETFRLPKVKLIKETARIMSLQDPAKKMSKSDENQSATLFLLDDRDEIVRKIKGAVTDSEKNILFQPERMGLYNLLNMYKVLSGKSEPEIEEHFQGKGYKELKEELAEMVTNFLKPVQDEYARYIKDKAELEALMKEGAEKAMEVSAQKIREVKQRIGLIL